MRRLATGRGCLRDCGGLFGDRRHRVRRAGAGGSRAAPGIADMDAAYAAFVAFGRGSGHPAGLNFGDVFSYALAKERGLRLLYKGDDFAQTDIVSALPA